MHRKLCGGSRRAGPHSFGWPRAGRAVPGTNRPVGRQAGVTQITPVEKGQSMTRHKITHPNVRCLMSTWGTTLCSKFGPSLHGGNYYDLYSLLSMKRFVNTSEVRVQGTSCPPQPWRRRGTPHVHAHAGRSHRSSVDAATCRASARALAL